MARAIKNIDRAFKKWKSSALRSRKDLLRRKWKEASWTADSETQQYEQHNIMQAATATRDPEKFWKLVKTTADVQSVSLLWSEQEDAFVFDDSKKADLLNTWFVSCQQNCQPVDTSLPHHLNLLPQQISE